MLNDDHTIELGPSVINEFGDQFFPSINQNTFNFESATALYDRYYPTCFLEEDQLNFIIGTDSGLFVNYLRELELPENSKFVFVEIEEVINHLKESGVIDDLPDQIFLLTYEELWEKQDEYKFASYVYIRNVLIAKAFCVLDGNHDIYRGLETSLTMEFENKIWALISNTGLSPFIERSFQNLCENRCESSLLKDLFKGKTAVLLGGGPSLDDLIPWLKKHNDSVVIITVSRVCRQLLKAEITPHIIVSVDHQDINFDISKDMLSYCDSSFFINGQHVSEKLLAQWHGSCAFLGPRFPWKNPYEDGNLDLSGPTVTNSALTIAVFLGFSQVILGGVDFCFSQSGYTHASGSDERKAGPVLRSTITVETNGGETANTSADYYNAMLVMEGQVGRALEAGCRVVNPARHAAKIENVTYVPIEKIAVEPLNQDPVNELRKLIPAGTRNTRIHHYEVVNEELQKVKKKIHRFKMLSIDALKCNDGLFGRKGMKADYKYKIKMDKIEKKLKREFSDLYMLVKNYSLKNFLQITRPDSEVEWTDEEVERIGHDYYQACKDSASELLKHVEAAMKRVRLRLEEEKENPDITLLTGYWREERQPGRAVVWKKNNPDRLEKLSDQEKDQLREIENEFETILRETETSNLKLRQEFASLSGVSSIAIRYFKARDIEGLERLREGLESHPDHENSKRMESFIQGLQFELQDKTDEAEECFIKVADDVLNIITEESLLRLLKIYLNSAKLKAAMPVAERLAEISQVYIPYLARIRELTGDKVGALDIYTDYLEKAGYDIPVMFKMGQLYSELEVLEGAQLMYSTILELDPENKSARIALSKLKL